MEQFLLKHADVIIALVASHGLMLLIALVSSMPSPDKPFSLYRWLYDGLHLFLNLVTESKNGTPAFPPEPKV
jgi:hypothetical protein